MEQLYVFDDREAKNGTCFGILNLNGDFPLWESKKLLSALVTYILISSLSVIGWYYHLLTTI